MESLGASGMGLECSGSVLEGSRTSTRLKRREQQNGVEKDRGEERRRRRRRGEAGSVLEQETVSLNLAHALPPTVSGVARLKVEEEEAEGSQDHHLKRPLVEERNTALRNIFI
ncbi:UNVERIFIED_CONTAM: hypothetical protein FKN15_036466 [Acipenser sinensis]